MKSDIRVLEKIYKGKKTDYDKFEETLYRLDSQGLAEVEVRPSDQEKYMSFLLNDNAEANKRISEVRPFSNHYDAVSSTQLTEKGVSILINENRHAESNRLQIALIVVTLAYTISAAAQILVSILNAGGNALLLPKETWMTFLFSLGITAPIGAIITILWLDSDRNVLDFYK